MRNARKVEFIHKRTCVAVAICMGATVKCET